MLLPLQDPDGAPFPGSAFVRVREELTRRYGGVTAYLQSPAEGAWEERGGVEKDRMVLYEVMMDTFDREWWRGYREELRVRFRQEELVVRSIEMERL